MDFRRAREDRMYLWGNCQLREGYNEEVNDEACSELVMG